VINADGSGLVRLTTDPDKTPTWAATGCIFFADHRDGSAQIASLDPDGKDLRVLLSVPSDTSETLRTPAVSPVGSKVVFAQALPTERTSNMTSCS